AFTADTAGTVTLNVVVTANGTPVSASAEVAVISPALAGTITVNASVAAGIASVTATIPPAQSGDRTFRWTLGGVGGSPVSGQGTNTFAFKPGSPGLLEVSCD